MTPAERRNAIAATQIRWAIRRDMPEIMDIEMLSWQFPMAEEEILSLLRNRSCIGMVAERKEQIIAFMIYELMGGRLWLHRLAVHPDFRRIGVGTMMIAKLESKLAQQRRSELFMEVSEDNFAAHLFLRALGVEANGVLRGSYGGRDAYQFSLFAERDMDECETQELD